MATEDLGKVLRNPGRLCFGPTDLSAAYPHGGTALGLVGEIVVVKQTAVSVIRGPDFGPQKPIEQYWLGMDWVLSGTLKQWDNDALNLIIPGSSAGTVTQDRAIKSAGIRAGTPMVSTYGVVLLFSPLDPYNPAVLFRRAVFSPAESAEMRLDFDADMEMPFLARAFAPADTDDPAEISFLEDITL